MGVLNAQSIPDAFSFQGLAMDANGNVIADANIAIELRILAGTPVGDSVYIENHNVTTTDLGHFNIEIGRGNSTLNNFEDIRWGSGNHFLEVSMDVTGGTNFSVIGVTQLVSVPYAIVALESGTGIVGPQGPQGNGGAQGAQGPAGPQGPSGLSCWDLNGNGFGDAGEDTNGDGSVDTCLLYTSPSPRDRG